MLGYATRYVRLPDLLIDLEMARSEGTYKKVMTKYASQTLLILDEWLLKAQTPQKIFPCVRFMAWTNLSASKIYTFWSRASALLLGWLILRR